MEIHRRQSYVSLNFTHVCVCVCVFVCVWVGQVRSIGCVVQCQQRAANHIRWDMFRQKQNQAIQLIGVHPLGAQLESLDPRSQQSDTYAATTLVSSSGGMQQRRQKGLKFYDTKMNPTRRSRSLESNLDNIDVDHVTFREGDKGKALHSSHPHSLDVNKSNQQRGSARFSTSHILGRRLQIIATPTSSSPPPPTTSSSPTVADIIKTNVETECVLST